MPGRDTYTGAKRAREARARWKVAADEPLPCVVALAELCAELPVVVAELPGELAGALDPRGLIWVNGAHAAVRCRFTVAHELGHLCCGHEAPTVDSVADLSNGWDPQEVQANAFAAELLAPAVAVKDLVDGTPTLEDVVGLAARFGMSCVAASYRLSTLGLATPERMAALKAEMDEDLHKPIWDALDPPPFGDLLGELRREDLPRLPQQLQGTVLHRWLAGDMTLEDAAMAAGVSPEALAGGLDAICGD